MKVAATLGTESSEGVALSPEPAWQAQLPRSCSPRIVDLHGVGSAALHHFRLAEVEYRRQLSAQLRPLLDQNIGEPLFPGLFPGAASASS